MDKNSLLGLGLIGGILILWIYWSKPSDEVIAKQKFTLDSIARVDSLKAIEAAKQLVVQQAKQKASDSIAATLPDSVRTAIAGNRLNQKYKDFAVSAVGKDENYILENKKIKATISSRGGRIVSVELKEYKKADKKSPVILFTPDSTQQSLSFKAYNNLLLNTDSLYFTGDQKSVSLSETQNGSIKLKLATAQPGTYIEYVYSLSGNDYMLNYEINLVGMQNIIGPGNSGLTLNWKMTLPSQEQHIEKERQTATAYWNLPAENDVDYINAMKDEEKLLESDVKWVAFKQQFFTSAIIADKPFAKGAKVTTLTNKTSPDYVKSIHTTLGIAYNGKANDKIGMKFYFGPNHYSTLKEYDLGLEKMIPIGWSIFSFLNKWLVIPVFNVLKTSGINYGIIIFVLTLIIKLLLSPIAYKTYLSSAKMRLLKPEIDEINAKYGDDPMKKNSETMGLYKKAGASPFSGCLPALIQIPILIALFNFFPASIELRQEEFLWAHDLSTYDSVWDFGYIPVINSIYGDHMSLFALLMFASTMVYTWMNQKMMPMNNQQMPGMQYMMYLMPVIFLSFMNSYSAGLSWYYFLANMITFAQTLLMRRFVDDNKLRAQIDENMTKPVKKSGFQQRLEDMQKKQLAQSKTKK